MKKFLSLALSLALIFSLAAPALAYEDTTPPLWQQYGYDSLEEYLDGCGMTQEEYERIAANAAEKQKWIEDFKTQNPDRLAAFDANTWFSRVYGADGDFSKANYMELYDLADEDAFRQNIEQRWLEALYDISVSRRAGEARQAAYPEEAAAFDAQAYFENKYGPYMTSEDYISRLKEMDPSITEKEFFLIMLGEQTIDQENARQEWQRRQEKIDTYTAQFPDRVANFDADAYYADQFSWFGDKAEFMEDFDLENQEALAQYLLYQQVLDWEREAEQNARLDAYIAAHPEEAAAFDPQAWIVEHLYYDSTTEYMEELGLTTDEEVYRAALGSWLDSQEQIAAFEDLWAEHQQDEPELTAQFLAELDSWFAEEFYYYDSLEEYFQEMTCPAEGYLDLYGIWHTGIERRAQEKARREAFFTDRGGDPNILNIMVNGAFLTFAEGQAPYAQDGVTYAPADVLGKALGLTLDGETAGVRAAAEAAGYTVYWDSVYGCVVLVRASDLAAQLDQEFTVFNHLFSQRQDGKTRSIQERTKLKLTRFNTLDGDQTYHLTASDTTLIKGSDSQTQLTMDLSALAELPEMKFLFTSLTEHLGKGRVSEVKETLSEVKLEVITNSETGVVYLRSPLIHLLTEGAVAKDAWVSISGQKGSQLTLGSIVAPLALSYTQPTYWISESNSPAGLWDRAEQQAGLYTGALGDQRFTETSTGWDYSLKKEDIGSLTQTLTDEGYSYAQPDISKAFRTFDITFHIGQDGSVKGSFDIRPDFAALMDDISYQSAGLGTIITTLMPMLDFQCSGSFSQSAARGQVDLELHFKNTYKYEFSVTQTIKETGEAVTAAPPEGDTVVALDEIW